MVCRFILILGFLAITLIALSCFFRRRRRKNAIGIFHLNCSSGGGGERVLWHTIKILLEKYPKYSIHIYTHKNCHHDPLHILLKAKNLFQIDLILASERLKFIQLSLSPLVEADRYSVLTLFMQNLMSVLVAVQAAYNLVPEVYMETIGFTYTLPIFKLLGCTVITYVHYPTISNDMIENVETSSHASFNNRDIFVRSSLLRQLKLIYYKLLAYSYGFAGRRADLVLVNSSWTRDHIKALWQTEVHVVYPPCDVQSFKSLARERRSKSKKLGIVSIAQFRPEKNHEMQIEAFDVFINKTQSDAELTMYGGCRDEHDQKRVDYLIDLIRRLDLGSRVKIVVNAPFEQLIEGVQQADVALHTMRNEHFGIALLEFMAAGLITVAHNSGGPKTDIINDSQNGFLCDDVEDFANKLIQISKMSQEERELIRRGAIKKADNFNVQVFESSLMDKIQKLLPQSK